jgi:hypothetical protein
MKTYRDGRNRFVKMCRRKEGSAYKEDEKLCSNANVCGIRLSEPQCHMHNDKEEMCFIMQVKVIVHMQG